MYATTMMQNYFQNLNQKCAQPATDHLTIVKSGLLVVYGRVLSIVPKLAVRSSLDKKMPIREIK